jgi:hypothetical protein
LPRRRRIDSVVLDGRQFAKFDMKSETISLPPRGGRHEIVVRTRAA